MSRGGPPHLTWIAVLASGAAGLAVALAPPRREKPVAPNPMLTERFLDHPERLRITRVPPPDRPPAAGSTSYRWAANELRTRWRRQNGNGYTTLGSPPIDAVSMDVFDSIVIELARVPAGGSLSLIWSHDESPSALDLLRNRREIALYGDLPRRTLVVRGDDIAPAAIGRDEPARPPVRFLFLRFPESAATETGLESVTLLSKADALGAPFGQARHAARGQTRNAAHANGRLRLQYETRVTDGSELLFGVLGLAGAPLRVEVDAGSATDSRALLAQSVTGGPTWQDLRVRIPRSRDGAPSRISLSVASSRPDDTVLVSEPTIRVARAAQRFPNVILYVIDGLRADRLGAYRSAAGTSPVFDSLARRGVLFLSCQAQATWTKPAIASLLTSLHPPTHGVGARSSFDVLPAGVPTLPALMRSHGYLTAQFTANAFASSLSGLDRGFDAVFSPEAFAVAGTLKIGSDDINRELLPWIEAHAGDRFFAYVHSIDVHPPYSPNRGALSASGSDAYDAEIRFNDRELGRLVATLERLELLEQTLIVVTADHGEAFGEHGRHGHGLSVHRVETHVPLLFVRPRTLAARVVEAPVQAIDVMPSILDHCGIDFDASGLQGRNVVSASGRLPAARSVFSTRYVYPEAAELSEFFGHEQYAASDGRHKLVATRQPGRPELGYQLYDIAADPDERSDVQSTEPEAFAALRESLQDFLENQKKSRTLFLARHDDSFARAPLARGEAVPQDTLDRLKSLGYLK